MKEQKLSTKIKKGFNSSLAILNDLLFPLECLRCHRLGDFICPACLEKIELPTIQVCPVCEQTVMPSGQVCRLCARRHRPPLRQLIVTASYQDKLIARAVHLFKYRFARELAVPLGQLLCRALIKNHLAMPDLIVPVPLHQRRLRWRGFNQAELLARQVANQLTEPLAIPLAEDLLLRRRYTPPQMKVKNYSQRFENIRDAFAVNKKTESFDPSSLVYNKNILLVDDVCTTGATLFECAQVLKKLEPKTISAVVIARQS